MSELAGECGVERLCGTVGRRSDHARINSSQRDEPVAGNLHRRRPEHAPFRRDDPRSALRCLHQDQRPAAKAVFAVAGLHLDPALRRQQKRDVIGVFKRNLVAARNHLPKRQTFIRQPQDINRHAGAMRGDIYQPPLGKHDRRGPVLVARGSRQAGLSRLSRGRQVLQVADSTPQETESGRIDRTVQQTPRTKYHQNTFSLKNKAA